MNNQKRDIFRNFWLKVISVFIALFVWLIVTNINDPIDYMRVYNVPVKLLHTEAITAGGDVYRILDNTDVVPTVTITAHRSTIDSLDDDNIFATADVENLTSLSTVEIHYYSTKYNDNIESIKGSIENVKLSIEKKKTSTFMLSTVTTGNIAEGYELGSVTPEQNQIRVSGPESIVNSIARATATVNISGATSSISTYSDISLLDEEDKPVDTASLTMNIDSVKVAVTILPVKTVPINLKVSGTPAEGYLPNGVVTLDPDNIQLAGRSSVLENVSNVTIPAEAADITDATSSLQTTVNLKDYLPEGTSFADSSFDGIVNVTVGIEAAQAVTVDADLDDIAINSVPSGYTARIVSISDGVKTITPDSNPATFSFMFSGLGADVDAIRVSDLMPFINVRTVLSQNDGAQITGTYNCDVRVTVPSRVTLTNNVTAVIEISSQSALDDALQGDEP